GFTSPDLIKYRYMMEGADPDWVEMSGDRKVNYANLSPGDYIFRVTSSTNGNIWSDTEARMRIRISPPFWLSIPAYILYLLTAAAISYFLIITYLKRKAVEHQRKIEAIEAGKEREILNAKIN